MIAFRVHHTLGDGMSFVAVGRAVLEGEGAAAAGGPVETTLGGGTSSSSSSPADAVVRQAHRGLGNFSVAKVRHWRIERNKRGRAGTPKFLRSGSLYDLTKVFGLLCWVW